MSEMKLGLNGIEGLKVEFTREKTPTGDDHYYHLHAEIAVQGKKKRSFRQSFTRETLEDDFESRFNILFELTRRRLLTMVAEERGEQVEEPFYGVTFGAGEKRDHRGVLVQDESDR